MCNFVPKTSESYESFDKQTWAIKECEKMRKELEPKCVPQLFLGSLLGRRSTTIGQLFPPFPSNSPEAFAKVNSAQFPRF